jgi:hypothetical protein
MNSVGTVISTYSNLSLIRAFVREATNDCGAIAPCFRRKPVPACSEAGYS